MVAPTCPSLKRSLLSLSLNDLNLNFNLLAIILILTPVITITHQYQIQHQVQGQSRSVPGSELELQLVQVLFRHGDRNPVEPYPNDPFKAESYWPEGFGQLTKKGKQQHYKLGQYFRKRYDGFLNVTYSPYEVHITSSDVDRTLMSAECNLAGLYPPEDAQSLWNPSLKWQPIPVHTYPWDIDNKLRQSAPCPKLVAAMDSLYQSPFMVQLLKENQDLLSYLTNNSGKPIKKLQDVDYLYDTLYIESLYNYTLPPWTKKVFPGGQFYNLTALSFTIMTWTEEMQRLKVGPLLQEFIQNFQNKINVNKYKATLKPKENLPEDKEMEADLRKKLFIYSGHDTTVANLLHTLGLSIGKPPPYASAVILELHKNTSDPNGRSVVKIYFKNETDTEPILLTVPGCNSSSCDFETFVQVLKPKIPSDWAKECQDGFLGLEGIQLTALILGTFFCLTLLGAMLVMGYLKQKRLQGQNKPGYPYLHLQMEDEDA